MKHWNVLPMWQAVVGSTSGQVLWRDSPIRLNISRHLGRIYNESSRSNPYNDYKQSQSIKHNNYKAEKWRGSCIDSTRGLNTHRIQTSQCLRYQKMSSFASESTSCCHPRWFICIVNKLKTRDDMTISPLDKMLYSLCSAAQTIQTVYIYV